ncbi:MAG: 3-methyl-2-oxobutanoate dehydrogenase subunit beta, partial [Spirochaetaceae bacterium]|nr:3-methyl-2-oxobutanoate dehydrogenase subunit beta [Spirochaetaceae bacterium]
NSLYIQPDELERVVIERIGRYAKAEAVESRCEYFGAGNVDIVVVAYGASARIAKKAVIMAREAGLKVGLFRPVTLWPFPKAQLKALAEKVRSMLVVEMSMGQMVDDVRLSVGCNTEVDFYGRAGGMIPEIEKIVERVKSYE